MKASVELSLYPLQEEFKPAIQQFILRLKSYPGVTVETNGMSTQLFGDYDRIFDILKKEMRPELENKAAVFVMKIAGTELRSSGLPDALR